MEKRYIELGLGGGRIIQIANRTLTQMMSYVIDTPEGNVIVIDGGNNCAEDAQGLYEYLCERGKKVDYWFMTHAHSDHIGAMLYLMENGLFDIEVGTLCFNFPSLEWLSTKDDFEVDKRFLQKVGESNIPVKTVQIGDIIECGSLKIEVICVPGDYVKYATSINSTSIIFKVYFKGAEVLFTGDFDVSAQADFLERCDPAKLKCDILQMPHHGQNGIDRSFYELMRPRICLYTAPQWLWENNNYRCLDPETVGKGPFTTLQTRRWMDELGAEASYTLADGDCIFE